MKDRVKPAWAIRIFAPLFFILSSLAAIFWFSYRLVILYRYSGAEIITLDKGSFYMAGVGLGLLVLAFVTVQEGWLDRPLSNKQSIWLTRISYISIIFLLLIPQLIHYIGDRYLSNSGYSVCEDASHQWLFIKDIVYIKESVECSENLRI